MADKKPVRQDKRTATLTMKVSETERGMLLPICEDHDRPLGYVARALMVRGLAAYQRDGLLKELKGPQD